MEVIDGRRKIPLRDWLALAAAIGIAALIAWPLLDRGWTPHDDGMLGQTAERIRMGQLPHRDFEELYTGALGYWNAIAQRIFGTTLMAPRYALFGVWCGWIAIVYGLIRRAADDLNVWLAAAITVAVAMWTLPVYPSAMPSWYLLFCATAAASALLKWIENGDRRLLFVAGAAIGIGLAIKVTALYLLAAAFLSIVFATQNDDRSSAPAKSSLPSAAVILGAGILAAMVLWLLRDRSAAPELVHLAAPVVILVLALAVRETRIAREGGRSWSGLFVPTGWLLAGVALPVVLFALPYLFSGSLKVLLYGVFIDPLSRIGGMNYEMRTLANTTRGFWFVALVAVELRFGANRAVKAAAVALALWFSVRSMHSYIVYQAVWEGARWLMPLTVLLVAFQFVQDKGSDRTRAKQRAAAITLAAFAALFGLNQFPFSANIYFCYAAPLVFIALARSTPSAASRLWGTSVLLGTFAVFSLHPGSLNTLGYRPADVDLDHRLAMPRGGLRVSASDSALYDTVQTLVTAHAHGRAIFAGPGLPEVAFLAGPPYYGHQVFHFLSYDVRDTSNVSRMAPPDSAPVLIWNLNPAFGESVAPQVMEWYNARFPNSVRVGDKLEVRWR